MIDDNKAASTLWRYNTTERSAGFKQRAHRHSELSIEHHILRYLCLLLHSTVSSFAYNPKLQVQLGSAANQWAHAI